MSESDREDQLDHEPDDELAELAEDMTRLVQQGETRLAERQVRRHPRWGDVLGGLLPLLQDLREMGRPRS